MLSYRHAFHAGNHADVIKHITMTKILAYLLQKDKPLIYMDSHSGGGLYSFKHAEAEKTGEYHLGIEKIFNDKNISSSINEYINIIKTINTNYEEKGITYYPGSPLIAKLMTRSQDQIIAMELHNNEIENLKQNLEFWKDKRVNIHHRDGFEGLKALTPPTIKRGLILIDPSYEIIDDYKKTMDTVAQVLQRWANAVIMVWYPFLHGSKDHSLFMHEKARKIKAKEIMHISLCPYTPQADVGMYGSGIFVFNPTFELYSTIKQILPSLHQLLKQEDKAISHVDMIVQNLN